MTKEDISKFQVLNENNQIKMEYWVHDEKIDGERILKGGVKYISERINTPHNLCKYYECNENNLNALKESFLWASDPHSFNDLLDCSVPLWNSESFTTEKLKTYLPSDFADDIKGENIEDNRNRFIDLYIRLMGVICLNSGKNKDLLWGYYNNNRGFCIEFDSKFLTEDIGFLPIKVDYCSILENEKLDFNYDFHPKMIRWSSIKKDNWKIEDEWRYIYLNTYLNRKKFYKKKSIKKIVLGYHFFEDFELIEMRRPIYLFRVKESTNRHKIKLLNYLKEVGELNVNWVHLDTNSLKLEDIPISIESKSCRNYLIGVQLNE